MPTLVTLKKDGKAFRISNTRLISDEDVNCPFCENGLVKDENFDLSGCVVQTENPEDLLPKSLKQSMSLMEGLDIYICKKCGSMFLEWEIGDYDFHEFYEIKDVEIEESHISRKGEKHTELD